MKMRRRLRIRVMIAQGVKVDGMITAILIFASASLFACANSGVVPTGQDISLTAMSEQGFTSGAVHEARLLKEASEYCKSIGKQMLATSTNHNDGALGKTPAAQ